MAITNAQLAQQVSELMDYWRTRDLQFAEWLSGSPSGGPYGDGRYPLSDYLGVIKYLFCPAALESGVASSASSAALSATLAGASKDEVLLAQAAAEAAQNQALTHRDEARASRDLALQYRDEAASHMSNANIHRNVAKAWAANDVDVIVEAGLYSARHYATKASETYAALAADLDAATAAAVSAATASATASASAAAQSATDAESAQAAAEAARNLALGYRDGAAASAADAAASAAAAQVWNPANYLQKAGTSPLTISHQGPAIILKGTATGDANGTYIEFRDSGDVVKGYVGDYSGSHGEMGLYAQGALALFGNGSLAMKLGSIISVDLDLRSRGHGRFTSWYGQARSSNVEGGGGEVGYSGGTAYFLGYDRSLNQYKPAYLQGHRAVLSSQGDYSESHSIGGLRVHDASGGSIKGYVYFDSTGFGLLGGNGNWAMRVLAGTNQVDFPSGDVTMRGFYNAARDGYIWQNTGSFTYGGWYVKGSRNGYEGIVLYDGVRNPTLMSNGSTRGLYCQATSTWDWYCTDSYITFGRLPFQNFEGSGGALFRMVQGQTGGRVWIQQGGVAQGSQEGDLTLIW